MHSSKYIQNIQIILFFFVLISFRHGYSEQEIEEAVLYRKPIASRALYILIERRLKEGLGWPDRTYNNSITGMSSSTTVNGTIDGSSDVAILDKLDRHEPLLPGRRIFTRQSSSLVNNTNRVSREKSNIAFEEQAFIRTNTGINSVTNGLTQEALNELVPPSRLTSRKLYHDIVLRKTSAVPTYNDSINDHNVTRRIINPNSLAPIKPSVSAQRGNILILQQQQQQQKPKPRSLPNSTLDHANQSGFHLPHDPYGSRASKNPSRTSHVEHSKKSQSNSPIRYNPSKLDQIFS